MSCEWWFYHLERPPLAAALAPLFEKCLERGWRVLVVSQRPEVLDEIDQDLWKYKNDSFLPHGREGEASAYQPILLSKQANNANRASILVLLNGENHAAEAAFERVMVVFADDDGEARSTARTQYRSAKSAGLTVRYFQQSAAGGWTENKA